MVSLINQTIPSTILNAGGSLPYCWIEVNQGERNHCFITGTSSGLGYALAVEYLKRGADVWGLSRRSPSDLQTHSNYTHFTCDLNDRDQLISVVRQLPEERSVLDTLILNAAVLPDISDMKDTSLEEAASLFIKVMRFAMDEASGSYLDVRDYPEE